MKEEEEEEGEYMEFMGRVVEERGREIIHVENIICRLHAGY